ncbi:MAG TPA: hypothetical protein VL326_35540 [Kofleriaceae bacterium]|jgi:hypothetical protein|nr:hypothetical protein [Kofleriaceae bacterium]
MRVLPLLLALAACKSGGSQATGGGFQDVTVHTALAEDDGGEPAPAYDKGDIQKALIAERAAEAKVEQHIVELEAAGDPDPVNDARADLAVRRRFIATLETCEATGRYCPPRLEEPAWNYAVDSEADPKLGVPLRFDLTSWQKVSAELHAVACGCRTLTCVDSINVAIGKLETRPMEDVRADETATLEITRGRECIYRLLGKRPLPRLETATSD